MQLFVLFIDSNTLHVSSVTFLGPCRAAPSWLCLEAVTKPAWNLPVPNVQ